MLEIEKTEYYINRLKESIEAGNRLERLKANEDFRALILNNYCKDYLIQLFTFVQNKQSEELEDAIAIAKFTQWINRIETLKEQAERELPEHEAYLIELKKENK